MISSLSPFGPVASRLGVKFLDENSHNCKQNHLFIYFTFVLSWKSYLRILSGITKLFGFKLCFLNCAAEAHACMQHFDLTVFTLHYIT
jgi:hypothetical protein